MTDVLGPLPPGDYGFVGVDYYSRFFDMEFTKSTTSEKIVSMLSKIFVTHTLPLSVVYLAHRGSNQSGAEKDNRLLFREQ